MKKLLLVGLLVIAAVLISFVWFMNTFTMFGVEEETLASHPVPGKDFTIAINRIAAGATTTDVIQVQKVHANEKPEILKVVESSSDLVSSELVADSLLRFILVSDTVEVAINRLLK
jgi:hypothetical protein